MFIADRGSAGGAFPLISKPRIDRLHIVSYPDPILRQRCKPVEQFGDALRPLVERMCKLMHEHRGVGLAAPQVGLPLRIFVWNPTGEPEHDAVCINPKLENFDGQEEADEGCLSISGVNVKVKRAKSVEVVSQAIDGSTFRLAGESLTARIWQHETDHLDGRLILDYMSPAEEIANRRPLKELEAKYKAPPKPRAKARASRR
jgi:peptide deformylase